MIVWTLNWVKYNILLVNLTCFFLINAATRKILITQAAYIIFLLGNTYLDKYPSGLNHIHMSL